MPLLLTGPLAQLLVAGQNLAIVWLPLRMGGLAEGVEKSPAKVMFPEGF